MNRNKTVQAFFYVILNIYMMLTGYLISIAVTGSFLSLLLAVMSVLKRIPPVLTDRWWIVYLISAIPLGIGLYWYQLVGVVKSIHSKQDKKQDNGKQ